MYQKREELLWGVLIQRLGQEPCPGAYFSKKLDGVVALWPLCLSAVEAIAMLIEEAPNLTLRQRLGVLTPIMSELFWRQKFPCV